MAAPLAKTIVNISLIQETLIFSMCSERRPIEKDIKKCSGQEKRLFKETCHASHVLCHLSCLMSIYLICFLSDKSVQLIVGGSVINGAYLV